MIVDLLRNDLGQICKTGSISAPRLLSVEQVGSLYQMTSEIAGSLRDEVGLLDILRASFPCGSVTGAPKRKSMEWIDRLEISNRGLYCGALGWLDPPKTEAHQSMGRSVVPRLGDFEWSVLIRTLVLGSDQSFEMGLGAGITIDSSPDTEWEECLSKAGFLLSTPPSLGLFETLRVEKGQAMRLRLHLSRLINSCRSLGIQATESALVESVNEALESLEDQTPHRLRIAIASNGRIDVSLGPLGPSPQPTVFWAEDLLGGGMGSMQKQNPTLHHKVDRRPSYDRAWQLAESLGGFDAIFTNEDGEVTEGGRSNVFVKKDGVWLTPPLSSGLLPGIMRAELLASKDWNAKESVIYPADVESAQEVVVCNSLRGVLKVELNSKPKQVI
jgi:para-aminobenzoate synthetase/4-amino-4-deoxychorismate lyase